jgi:hypothetical protein
MTPSKGTQRQLSQQSAWSRSFLWLLLVFLLALSACQDVSLPGLSSLFPTATATQRPTPLPDTLYVNTDSRLGEISPYLYGTNYGPAQAIPLEMMPYAKQAGFTVFRFPGGAWTDRGALSPVQIDQFIEFCKEFNALPTISVALKNGSPEMAAELVRYTNIEQRYKVKYWSIGNEPTLYEHELGETYDTVRFNQEWRAIALAMKAVDPTIKLMGPELHQWGTSAESTLRDSSGRDWMIEFLKENGDLVDVITVHRYPLWKPFAESVTPSELRENTQEWEDLVIYLRQLIHEHTGRDLPIAFTEVNSDPRSVMMGEATPDTLYNAIWYADVLGKLGRQNVFMVNQWVVSQSTTGLGLFMRNTIRATLYTFSLYTHFGNERVYASSGFEYVNIYAARREDGALSIMIVNLNDEQKDIPLRIDGMRFKSAEAWRLDASHEAESIGSLTLGQGTILTLPGWSATLYVLYP